MARIPLGSFGNVIAQPPQRENVVPGAFDGGGRALQHLGDVGMQVAASAMEEQRHQDAALARAKAANAVLDREIAVKAIGQDIEQQVNEGKIHYNDAHTAYKQRVSDLGTPDMAGMDPVTVENFTKGVKRADFIGENAIGGTVARARQADFRSQTDGILDKLGKQASLPGANPAQINAQADGLDEIGKQAYGAAWGKKKQDWVDSNWDAHLNQQAMTVRDDLAGIKNLEKQITEGDYADKLDSNRRNSLVAKLEAYKTSLIQRQEAAASRAQREQERVLKRAEAEFNTFQSLADKGTILAPEYIDRAIQLTAGTPYQNGIQALAKQAQETGGLAAQPVGAQQKLLDQVDTLIAKQGRTPELDKRREQIVKVLHGSQSDLKENGLRAGLERGVIRDMAPLDVSTPEAFASSIVSRLTQAETVSLWAGKPVSPLDAGEADAVRNMLDALPPKQKSQAVSTISAAVGPRFSGALALQVEKQDKALALAFATSASRTTGSTNWLGNQTIPSRFISELIFKGAQAIKDDTVMKDDKNVTGWKSSIAKRVEGAFPDESLAVAVKDSAHYILAGLAHENGGSVGSAEIDRAVMLAVGGEIIERNGKKLPIPAGLNAGEFEKRLRNLPASDILKQASDGKVRVGGVEMSASDFAVTIPGQELMYAGPGRYAVIVKGRPVMNTAGRPIIIGVK